MSQSVEGVGVAPAGPSRAVKSLAVLLAMLLAVTLPLALLFFNLGRVVFNAPLVKRVVSDEVVNSQLLPVALEWFSERRAQQRIDRGEALAGVDEPDVVLLLSFLHREEWAEIKTEVLPDEILIEWTSATVDGTYAWIDSPKRVPQIVWPMRSFKDRVATEHGANAIQIAYDQLPPCEQAQIDDFLARQAAAPSGTEVLYNLCAFPDPWRADQLGDYLNSLGSVAGNVPDQFELTRELAQAQDTQGVGPEPIKQSLRLTRLLSLLAWLAPLVLAILIVALCVRSLADLNTWVSRPVLVGSLLALVPALLYGVTITFILAAGPLSEVPELVRREATRAILRLAREVFVPLLIQAAVLAAIAAGLMAWGRFKGQADAPPADDSGPAEASA